MPLAFGVRDALLTVAADLGEVAFGESAISEPLGLGNRYHSLIVERNQDSGRKLLKNKSRGAWQQEKSSKIDQHFLTSFRGVKASTSLCNSLGTVKGWCPQIVETRGRNDLDFEILHQGQRP